MKRVLTLFLLVLLALYALPGYGRGDSEGRRLSRIGEALGIDLSGGTLAQFEDSHGGFHGDGLTSAVVELDGLGGELMDARGWKPLPLSENAAQALRICGIGEGASVEEGYYYLYDRHSESRDPYDDTQLCGRFSWNFTAAVYDSQSGRLYFYQMDT